MVVHYLYGRIFTKEEYSYRNFNQINYFESKAISNNERIRKEIKSDLEQLDKTLRESAMRKQKRYVIKGYVPRKIITIYGQITFIRTKYQYYDQAEAKTKTVYLVDNYIQLERYKRMNLHLRLEIMKQLATGKRQRDIVDQFQTAGITRASISNLARSIDTKNLNDESLYWDYKIPTDIAKKEHIYLLVDDTFTSLRHKTVLGEYRIRLAVSHLGHVNSNSKRKALLQKRAFYLIERIPVTRNKISTYDFAKQVQKQLTVFYGDINNKKIIVCGDGATWIQDLASYLNADYVLDKYHLTSLIYKTFAHQRYSNRPIKNVAKLELNLLQKGIYDHCCQYLAQGNAHKLITYLKTIMANDVLQHKNHKIKELLTYVINHQDGINNYKKSYYIGCQTEAMISHLIKSIKGYGAKIYNFKTFVNLLNLRLGHINQLSPINIYCDKVMENAEIKKSYFAENIWLRLKNNNYQSDIEPPEIPILTTKNSELRTFIANLVANRKF